MHSTELTEHTAQHKVEPADIVFHYRNGDLLIPVPAVNPIIMISAIRFEKCNKNKQKDTNGTSYTRYILI